MTALPLTTLAQDDGATAPLLNALPMQSEITLFSSIGRVNRAGFKSREMCSGSLVAPNLVLTAAHCADFAAGRTDRWSEIIFVSGWDGATHAGASRAADVVMHPFAFLGGKLRPKYDLALIRLDTPLSIPALDISKYLDGRPVSIAGYRHDRPHRLSVQDLCAAGVTQGLLAVDCPVTHGQSGGPVIQDGALVGVVSLSAGQRALAVLPDIWLVETIARLTSVSDG